MSDDDYEVEDSTQQLRKDFLAIVDAPENRLHPYQKAAEQLAHREESGIELAAYLRSSPLPKSLLFGEARQYWSAQLEDTLRAHSARPISPSHPITAQIQVTYLSNSERSRRSTIGYSKFYRCAWMFLAIASMVWGGIVGASLAGAQLVGPVTAASGVIGLLGLSVTLFVAGRRSKHERG